MSDENQERPMVSVDRDALYKVLMALVGEPHLIRELTATMTPEDVFPDNPINRLIKQYNEHVLSGAHDA